MPKSEFAKAVDDVQRALRPRLKALGFRVRGRTFNRVTDEGLTQVVNIQMGPSDPPGTTYIPGLREDFHGLFAVNLGVYVPEVANLRQYQVRSWVQEAVCCVRSRLGRSLEDEGSVWWHARNDTAVIEDVWLLLESEGMAFLDRFSTRAKITEEATMWRRPGTMGAGGDQPRIVMASIFAEQGRMEDARDALRRQIAWAESNHPSHAEHVRGLVSRLGLGRLGG